MAEDFAALIEAQKKENKKDNKALLAAQKETTRALMSTEEKAKQDAEDVIKNQNRIEGGRKAWQTRQENITSNEQSVFKKILHFLSPKGGKSKEENQDSLYQFKYTQKIKK